MSDKESRRLLIRNIKPALVFGLLSIGLMLILIYGYSRGQSGDGDCIVKGKKVDNCIDLIYDRTEGAAGAYPAARLAPKDISIATRYKFVEADGEDWLDTFFGHGEATEKLQEVFKTDPKVDFEAFYKLNLRFKLSGIDGLALFREGFIVIWPAPEDAYSYIIPISPETVDRIKALDLMTEGEPPTQA